MNGKIARKLVAAAVLLAVSLTTGDVARQATKGDRVAAAAPTSATDEAKIPHYFGPYPNWANSPQVLADAVVTIGLGTPTPIAVGNPLTARANATDYATPPGVLGPVFTVLPNAVLPDGSLQSFQTWNQADGAGSPTPSAGGLFHAYVLRPTGAPSQYTVVYDSGQLSVPSLANSLVSEVATFPVVPAVAVQTGDVLGFYGQGIPVDTGVTANPDLFSYPATADTTLATNVAPAVTDTLTIGTDPGYPLFPTQDRTYSFSAMVTPNVVDPGTGAQATATVDPKTGAVSSVTVTSPGAGYVATPNVSITSPGVTPTALASATAQIATGVITGISVNEAGYGFTTPTVTITGGNPTVPAVGQASGGIDDITVVNGGSGYLIQPIVEISLPDLPGGVQATATATMTSGIVDPTITVVNPGSGYTSAPTVTILDATAPVTTPGVAAVATATIGISQIDITSGGQGYDSAPIVTITDSGGIDRGASATATVAVKGSVTAITVTAPGAGYLTPGLKKFVDTLPGLGPNAANNYGEYIPVAVPDTTTYPGADYYEIAVVQYRQKFSSQLPESLLRGYVQLSTSVVPGRSVPLTNANLDPTKTDTPIADYTGVDNPHYLGPTIVATKDRPVRILFRNLLPTGVDGNLFLPVDTSLMGAGVGPDGMMLQPSGVPMDMVADTGSVLDGVRNPACGQDPKPTTCYSENRATLHMHGGITPWISDGTPHQWTTPAGEATNYPQGVSVSNVPDMPDPGPGALTFFYTNQQSARLMFYHDHAWGITRLNVYAGEAAGYLLTDDMEQKLIGPNGAMDGLGLGTPLIVQDKTFVPSADKMAQQDPTWDSAKWGGEGNLWTPHVYMPAQNPADPSGMSSFGRWMYGPWFWPPAKDAKYPPIDNPYYDPTCDPNVEAFCEPPLIPSTPNVSVGMEAFNDTPIVNGTAYPTTTVDPKAYRYRILNAANDRFWNLSWYVADPTTGTLSEVALKANEVEAAQTDPNVFPTPDTAKSPAGPSWVQIGTEGGFLPTPVVVPSHPITWITDPTRFDVGNVDEHSLLLAPAERADVIVDFSQYRGKTLILYNDAPAAFPARVAGYDYYTGGPDLSPAGAPTTLPGYGPNTRTIMQVKVSSAAPAIAFDRPNTTADRMGALMTAFAHHADGSGVFESASDPIIVGQAAYNDAYGTQFVDKGWCNSTSTPTAKCDGYARIAEGGQPTDLFKFDTLAGSQLKLPFQPKGIHDEMNSASFDEWGRMTANMGLEAPGATPLLQNIILYPYVNPPTENLDASGMPSSLDVTPITSAADGTQLWKITHNGVDTHPIHFHLYNVQVINRVTWDNIIIPPDPTELGWKDTVRVSPLEDTIVALRPIVPVLPFAVPDSKRPLNPMMPIGAHGDANGVLGTEAGFNNTDSNGAPINPIVNEVVNFGWEYVIHCHILSHEEMDMMRPVTVKVPWAAPPAPTGLSFTRGSVILSWTDPTPVNYSDPKTWNDSNQEIGFRIERAPVDGPTAGTFEKIETAPATSTLPAKYLTAPANSTTFTYVPPDPTISYDYRVTAFNMAGTASSNVVRVEGLPASPTTLTAVAGLDVTLTAGGKVVLDWTNVSPTATSVEVERAAGTGPFTLVDTVTPAPVGPGTYTDTLVPVAGPFSYRVRAVNAIGASAYSNVATVTIPLAASSTDLVSSQNPSTFGQSVTFTATVSSAAATATPGGSVEFFDGSASLGIVTMVAGVASVPTSGLSVGSHVITAQYGGDAIFATSTSPSLTQVVDPNTTSTVLVGSGSPSAFGDPVTFTATVTPSTATGTVQFMDGAATLGSPVTLSGGVATFQTDTLSVGSHSISAVYSGDAAFAGSTSGAVTQVVDLRTTAVAVDSSLNPSLQGSPVTFTATVTSALTTPIPGGSVSFFDGTTPLGTGTMSAGGIATVTTSSLSAGSHDITAQYGGDASFAASTSPLLTQVVDLNATSTVVVSSGSPSLYGDAVTFTATVSPPTASGNVQFKDGTAVLGSGSLSGGVATFQTLSLSGGTHSITAVYGGDASFSGSTSATVTQVVDQGTTATAVGSSLNPSVEGDSVTFTANVTTLTGVGSPGGTVQFMDGAVALGSPMTLSGGTASLPPITPTAGLHNITAVYSGDTNFTGSTSSVVLTQNVLRKTTTVVTSNRTPAANLGQTITFTAQVRPATGTGIPSGSVSFTIDGTITSPVLTLNLQGRATFQIATLPAGNHTVIATYGATTVFGGSTSVPIVQVVNQAATTTTVTSNTNPSVFGRSVTLTARVQPNPGAGINVEFFDGGTSLGSFPLDATGRARLTLSTLGVGPHAITAAFPGTRNHVASTSPVFNQTVNKANSRTVVTTSGSPANRGTDVTFTATVSAVAPGAGVRTGSVQFRIDGTNVVPTVDLNASGQATMTTSTLAVGSHTVSAVYSGDGNFNTSTSANITQRIR